MDSSLLDNPLIRSILFHPRAARPVDSPPAGMADGAIPADDGTPLGYRLYNHTAHAPLVLLFHGNGEIAPDYDGIAELYHQIGLSLLVADFRGYGWSGGEPRVSTLLPDAAVVSDALPDVLTEHDLHGVPCVIMGRSLGSACAIHVAHRSPALFQGLIIESGFAHVLPLLARLGLPTEKLADMPDPIGNARKIGEINLPTLIIHGERDSIIPVANGQTLYEASSAEQKDILRVPGAGHNDLLFVGRQAYFAAIDKFVNQVTQRD